MSNKGKLVVVSGFSGAGKGTLMKALMEQYGDDYALSVSATTRDPRPGEKDGIDYFYVTTEKFKQMIEADELIEYAQYVKNYYGTPKAYVQQQLDLGKNVILEIEIQGALKIKKQFPDTIITPSELIKIFGHGQYIKEVDKAANRPISRYIHIVYEENNDYFIR